MGCKLSFPRRPKKARLRALKLRVEELEEEINALKSLLCFDMETLILGYEHIAWQIFGELDDETLGNCRLVSKSWKQCIDNGKSFWICLHQRFKNFPVLKTPEWGENGFCIGIRKQSILDEFPDMRIVFDYLETKANVTELKIFLDFFKELKKRYNEQGINRYTDDHPLHYAFCNDQSEVLQLLVKKCGIDLNTPNLSGKTILESFIEELKQLPRADVLEAFREFELELEAEEAE